MLQVKELNQYYGGSHILRGVNFEARIGEVTCLLGRNGVGKTTLLKCLMGPAAEACSGRRKMSLNGSRISGSGPVWRMSRRGVIFFRV